MAFLPNPTGDRFIGRAVSMGSISKILSQSL